MRWISLISSGHSIQMQKNTPYSQLHGTFSSIGHILGHKSNLSKFKKIEIISRVFSDHNTMRLDINYKRKGRTPHNDQGINPGGGQTVVNIYAPNIEAPQCIRQTLTDIKGEIDNNTIIVGDFTLNRKLIRKHKY